MNIMYFKNGCVNYGCFVAYKEANDEKSLSIILNKGEENMYIKIVMVVVSSYVLPVFSLSYICVPHIHSTYPTKL
jgi:hypothetical protein